MKKKIFAVLALAILLALSMAPAAWAAEKLPTPTELQWDKGIDWSNDRLQEEEGSIAWNKNGANTTIYLVRLYYTGLAGKDNPIEVDQSCGFTVLEENSCASYSFFSQAPEDYETGYYYCTVQAISMDKFTQDSDIVKSPDYLYAKPTAKLDETFNNIVWDIRNNAEPAATWQVVTSDSRSNEYEVEFLYAANANDIPERISSMIDYTGGKFVLDDYCKLWGAGYYYFRVRAYSDSIYMQNSEWSKLSDAFYLATEDVTPVIRLLAKHKTIVIKPNETEKIEIDVVNLPDKYADKKEDILNHVFFVSYSPEIAEVDNYGNIVAKQSGETIIMIDNGFSYYDEKTDTYLFAENDFCKIIVTGTENIPVNGVTLDKTALNLAVSDNAALQATVAPTNATNKSVRWSSNNTAVATVNNNGNVKAVSAGQATITVTTEDGRKTATCQITVTERKVPVTSITLDKTSLSLEVKNTAQLKATVLPADTTSKIAWTSSNEKVATVNETGKVTALTKGAATITATADGVKAECRVTVTADTVYTITFDTDGGTLAAGITNPDYVVKGAEYKMPTANKSRYKLTAWAIGSKDSANQVKANDVYTFTEDTTVYAIWQYNGGGGGGSHRPSGSGTTTPTKPTNPEKPGNSGNTGSSTVTAANIKNVFADVQNNAWYSEAIAYVYNKGMMNGTDAGKFEPNATTTRAMLVTMLHRLENEPAAAAAKFSDVASGQWFSKAVAWAAANGVVNGYENGTFAPNAAITREQLAAILYRFAQFKGYDVSVKGNLSSFSDNAQVSDWAKEAMQWAVGAGIINGDNNALKPTGNATRAEVAIILMHYIENVVSFHKEYKGLGY